jgi:hypothetical protein
MQTRARVPRTRWTTLAVLVLALACGGQPPQEEMKIQAPAKPAAVVASGARWQAEASRGLDRMAGGSGEAAEKQILFGDLHVHSTFSFDAYMFSLPLLGGEGARPPADACDFARYCSNLDFFSVTDHAESLRPEHWEISKQSVRECNALAGDPRNPDVVAFAGYEWSQAGLVPEKHFGHRCLIFKDQDDASLPPRPLASEDKRAGAVKTGKRMAKARFADLGNWKRYTDYVDYTEIMAAVPLCEDDVPTLSLPRECLEIAETPRELHRKLDEWGGEVLEIPHGTAWGVYTPNTTSIDKHLAPEFYDAEKMKLIEIASGHGNSEEFRSFEPWSVDDRGNRVCEPPTADFLPCCWQAGEIMRSRCGDLPADECERRVDLARQYSTEVWTRPNQIFPDAAPEEWLDCGQCRDCFKPSYGYRPKESVQYAMALTEPDASSEATSRFRYGFIGSSDEHSSRPGVGYKAVDRGLMTDVNEVRSEGVAAMLAAADMDDPQMPIRPDRSLIGLTGNDGRVQNFLYPGGLAAVHASSRSREDIWDAMQRKEVYGTSGPRILLWFDLLNGPGATRVSMGGDASMTHAPEFEVRAVGSFEPKPGCPGWAVERMGAERTAALCHDECYHPSDVRRPIASIEVVRILPQSRAGEPIAPLIQDPWQRFECEPRQEGCVVRFSDDDYADLARDAVYYVRAHEEARPAIMGNPLRTQFDAEGNATSISLCPLGDDCLEPLEERAWSSPIFIDYRDS